VTSAISTPGNGARAQIVEQAAPGERRTKFQLAVQALRGARRAAQFPRTQAIARFEQGIEAPHAAEAAGKGDLGLAHAGVCEQALRQQQPLCLRKLDGRHAEFGLGDPAQMPVADAERCRQFADFGARQRVFFNA
jgi:hypothetical protein